jgi:alanyl-tRNA synthetase
VLGEHALQRGSLVAPDRLRFDFTHTGPLTPPQREAVERRVYEQVLAARPVRAREMSLDEARRLGATALFGEKYGERVRVVEIAGYSRELCGGTHVTNTAEIGAFAITGESSAAAGIRRLEAVTGWGAYDRARAHERLLAEVAAVLRTSPTDLLERARRLAEQAKGGGGPARPSEPDLDVAVRLTDQVDGVRVVAARLDGATHEVLRAAGDRLRERMGGGVYVIAGASGDRVHLVAMVTPDAQARGLRADVLLRALAAALGGNGGGRADLAQGAGRDPAALAGALDSLPGRVRDLLATG